MSRLFFSFVFFAVVCLPPLSTFASHTSDPTVSLLQNRISKNFSKKFCNAIKNGLSKDEAMTCLLYTSDAADEGLGVDLGGRRIIKIIYSFFAD